MWNYIAKKREAEGQWEELKPGNCTTDSQTFSMCSTVFNIQVNLPHKIILVFYMQQILFYCFA